MIQKLTDHKIKNLNRISPSQYHSATNCPYKLVLANSFGYQPLLPLNANAYCGSIIHKMIELISNGIINDEQMFTEYWTDLVNKKEEELKEKGLSSITPLKYFVTDFALKKNQIKNILKRRNEKISTLPKTSSSKFYPEKKLENSDKSITGIADLIIEGDLGTTILDFKTGKVYADAIDENGVTDQVVKTEYEIQLKLYAHLYFLMYGKYPKALLIVSLSNDFIEVEFKNTDCEIIYSEALDFLVTINSFITENDIDSIAKPSTENCKYCLYRPACDSYSKWLISNFENVFDLFGILLRVILFENNSIGIELQFNTTKILVNGFANNLKEELESLLGKQIILYNLRKTKHSLNASANSYTMIYEN